MVNENYKSAYYIFSCFAIVLLSCAAKNYLTYFLNGTVLCEFLCPSAFGRDVYTQPVILNKLYEIQFAIREGAQDYINLFFDDNLNLFSIIIVTPLIEETIYRSPLFFFRRYSRTLIWWIVAVILTILFVLSHTSRGLALLPLFVLGLSASWLIKVTNRFWPALALHFLNNFYFFSITLYQTFLWGD